MNNFHTRLALLICSLYVFPAFAGTKPNSYPSFQDMYKYSCDMAKKDNPIVGSSTEILFSKLIEQKVINGVDVSDDMLEAIAEHYRIAIPKIVARIQDIQKNSANPTLHVNGDITSKIRLIVINGNENETSVGRDRLGGILYLPASLVIRIAHQLHKEQGEHIQNAMSDNENFAAGTIGGKCLTPLFELDDAVYFVIAHEITHLWLHQPGQNPYSREIEADAWAVELTSATSEVSKFRSDISKYSGSGLSGKQNNNSGLFKKTKDISLFQSRVGVEIADILYVDKLTDKTRQSGQDRKQSISTKYEEVRKMLAEQSYRAAKKVIADTPEYQQYDQGKNKAIDKQTAEMVDGLANLPSNNLLSGKQLADATKPKIAELNAFLKGMQEKFGTLNFCRDKQAAKGCADEGKSDNSGAAKSKVKPKNEHTLSTFGLENDIFSKKGKYNVQISLMVNDDRNERSFAAVSKPVDKREYCDTVTQFIRSSGLMMPMSCSFDGDEGSVWGAANGVSVAFKSAWSNAYPDRKRDQ